MLIRYILTTPDGTELISTHRHNYVVHKDANGKEYGIDGGNDYCRLIGDIGDCTYREITSKSPHEEIREYYEWGTYGINGDQSVRYIKLKDLSIDHIKAILSTQTQLKDELVNIFNDELEFRKD